MTKVVCFSDSHGLHRDEKINEWLNDRANSADILLFAGDYQYNDLDDGSDFISWIARLPYYNKKVVIPGNHDGNFRITAKKAKEYKNVMFQPEGNVLVNSILIYCSAYSKSFGNWWFMESEEKLSKRYSKIDDRIQILLTHTPPANILDKTIFNDSVGSIALKNELNRLSNLKYHVFGHIHESYGRLDQNSVTFLNCSICNEIYQVTNMPILFEIKKG